MYQNVRSFGNVVKDCCNQFSKSVFWLESKSSYSNGSFLLLSNIFRKNGKKLNAKRYGIVCALLETEEHIN